MQQETCSQSHAETLAIYSGSSTQLGFVRLWFICTWIQACSLLSLLRDFKRTGGGPEKEELNECKIRTDPLPTSLDCLR